MKDTMIQNMKTGFCVVVTILSLLASLNPVHAAALVIAAEDAAAPWSYQDGTGYANDVIMESFRAVGVEVTFKVVPYARCKRMVVSGDVVGCFSMSPEQELEKTVTLSDMPLFIINFDYFHNLKKPLKVKKEQDIPPGTRVGVVTGYEYPESAMKLKEKGVIFQEARDEETNLKKLALGRIDAAIIDQNQIKPASAMIDNAGAQGVVDFLFRSGTMGTYIGFSKKHPQGEFARKKFNEGFRIIRKNGTLKRIRDNWSSRLKTKSIP